MKNKTTDIEPERPQTEDLFKQLISAYKNADDYKMSQAIEVLSEKKMTEKKQAHIYIRQLTSDHGMATDMIQRAGENM